MSLSCLFVTLATRTGGETGRGSAWKVQQCARRTCFLMFVGMDDIYDTIDGAAGIASDKQSEGTRSNPAQAGHMNPWPANDSWVRTKPLPGQDFTQLWSASDFSPRPGEVRIHFDTYVLPRSTRDGDGDIPVTLRRFVAVMTKKGKRKRRINKIRNSQGKYSQNLRRNS